MKQNQWEMDTNLLNEIFGSGHDEHHLDDSGQSNALIPNIDRALQEHLITLIISLQMQYMRKNERNRLLTNNRQLIAAVTLTFASMSGPFNLSLGKLKFRKV